MVLIQRELKVGQSTGVRQEGRSAGQETMRWFGTKSRRQSGVSPELRRHSCRCFICGACSLGGEWRDNCEGAQATLDRSLCSEVAPDTIFDPHRTTVVKQTLLSSQA